uniref:Uncharacterized protein n=1 Tax=Meloidogyne incognita TaxID=6306 RepID=A0A914N0P2_MELIC
MLVLDVKVIEIVVVGVVGVAVNYLKGKKKNIVVDYLCYLYKNQSKLFEVQMKANFDNKEFGRLDVYELKHLELLSRHQQIYYKPISDPTILL